MVSSRIAVLYCGRLGAAPFTLRQLFDSSKFCTDGWRREAGYKEPVAEFASKPTAEVEKQEESGGQMGR